MLRVLLVDDEPFIVQGLTVLIDWEKAGYEIAATAANGKEALDYLKENQVELILADIKMPVMTGLELLEKIRSETISVMRRRRCGMTAWTTYSSLSGGRS